MSSSTQATVDSPPPPPEEPHPDDHPDYKAPVAVESVVYLTCVQTPMDLLGAIKAGAALKSVPPPPVDGLGDHLKHGLMAEVHSELDSMRRNSTLMDTFRFESAKGNGIKVLLNRVILAQVVIHTIYTLKSGKTDDFKDLAGKLIDAVKTNEKSSSSGFMFSTTEAANTAVSFSFYETEGAALAHIRNPGVNQLIPELEAICDDIHMNVFGKVEERTRKAFVTYRDLNDFHVKITVHSPIGSSK